MKKTLIKTEDHERLWKTKHGASKMIMRNRRQKND